MSIEHAIRPQRASRAADEGQPRGGRYEGGTDEAFFDLRVETGAEGPISADIYRERAGGGRDWVASISTVPGGPTPPEGGSWPVVAEDGLGAHTVGRFGLRSLAGTVDVVSCELMLDGPLNGVPGRREIVFTAQRVSGAIRALGIELETELGVAPPAAIQAGGRTITIRSCLRDAGFEVGDVGAPSRIPRKPAGWGTSELHTLMQDFASASLDRRAWELHLLLLSRADDPPDRGKLLGVMFDTTQQLPRQGAAVFADSIRSIPDIDHDRKVIHTTVHELGHALNLAHRFEREVGQADSLSFMNYDWRYKGRDHQDEYWAKFAFTFDRDELAFLRHGPRTAVIPGGAAFHSRRYWSDGSGGYSPYVPEVPRQDVRLSLRPPQSGRLFEFAQPVFLEVELANVSGAPMDLSPILLDPKASFLELLVRRTHGGSTRSLADTEVFRPILQRCFDLDPGAFATVPHGGSIRNNVNLTYGSGGFPFAEPGAYEITALVAVPIGSGMDRKELIVRSEPLPIRVAAPQSIQEDREAMELFRDDVGVYLALGGSHGLTGARDALDGIVERRQANATQVRDPIVATILRAQALDAGRSYVRYEDGEFREVAADPDRAAYLLDQLDETALRTFDCHTADATRRLAQSYRH